MEDEVKQILADILDVEESAIGDDFGPDDAERWDSLNNLRLITALEEAFDVQFSMSEIQGMNTFSAIMATIKSRAGG